MKRALREAMEAGDVAQARSLLVDALRRNPGNKETMVSIRTVMLELPDLFDKDGDELYTLPREEWNDAYSRTVELQLVEHFTADRFSHFIEVIVELEQRRKSAKKDGPVLEVTAEVELLRDEDVEVRPATFTELVAAEEVVDLSASPAGASDASERLKNRFVDQASEEAETKSYGRTKATTIVGYILMALGAAAAIVGAFVPAHFITGIGIGIFMVGTAVGYTSITITRN